MIAGLAPPVWHLAHGVADPASAGDDGRRPGPLRRRHRHGASTSLGGTTCPRRRSRTAPGEGTKELTGMVDLSPDQHGRIQARLLDLVPGRSGKAYGDWLKEAAKRSSAGSRSPRSTRSTVTGTPSTASSRTPPPTWTPSTSSNSAPRGRLETDPERCGRTSR